LVHDHVDRNGFSDLVRAGPTLLRDVTGSERFERIVDAREQGNWRVRPEILFPEVSVAPPHLLSISRSDFDQGIQTAVQPPLWSPLHRLIATLSGPGVGEGDASLDPTMREMMEALGREGLLEDAVGDGSPPSRLAAGGLIFLGHNTVVVRSRTAAVIIDPFLFSHSGAYPPGYQPLQWRDVGSIDAVFVTHSHPDHFSPGSLLRVPPETRVVVPRVDRETLLAVAMEQRLRELGFEKVDVLDWWQRTTVGDIEVYALPFHGEQPTDGDVLHPEVRNQGNVYLVRTPSFSAAFLADSGRDGRGDVRAVAAEARARFGPVDLVFSGYRGWLTYPVQFLFTSVAPYILLVPSDQWGVRQRIMTTADEAVDVAEAWGGRYLVPYADGGAPWFWQVGLGPRLDEKAVEATGFDPFPERVVQAARNRTEMPGGMLGSAVEVLLLRPGDSVVNPAGAPEVIRVEGHRWPYPERLQPGEPAPVRH
jgi:L-ascorbate metabolism protein UlaG (beta-lactamase superfamily)